MEVISITSLIDLIIYIIKGIIIGIVASAPMGPVGILCIRRTIKKGRIYGLATGAGGHETGRTGPANHHIIPI